LAARHPPSGSWWPKRRPGPDRCGKKSSTRPCSKNPTEYHPRFFRFPRGQYRNGHSHFETKRVGKVPVKPRPCLVTRSAILQSCRPIRGAKTGSKHENELPEGFSKALADPTALRLLIIAVRRRLCVNATFDGGPGAPPNPSLFRPFGAYLQERSGSAAGVKGKMDVLIVWPRRASRFARRLCLEDSSNNTFGGALRNTRQDLTRLAPHF